MNLYYTKRFGLYPTKNTVRPLERTVSEGCMKIIAVYVNNHIECINTQCGKKIYIVYS